MKFKSSEANFRVLVLKRSRRPSIMIGCGQQCQRGRLMTAHENLPRMIWTSYAFYSAASAWNFGSIFEWMVRDDASTSQLCLVLGLEAGRCDFRGENWLDAGVVLKCFPPLSLTYYSQLNAERKTSKMLIFAILSCKDDKTQQMR